MAKREKEYMVEELIEKLKSAPSLFVTGFRGLTALEMDDLRRKLEKVSSNYIVVKNKIAKLALERSNSSKVIELLDGPCGFTYGDVSPETISKTLIYFAKDHEALKICGALAFGEVLTGDYIEKLAALPSREVLLGRVVSGLASPISGLVGVFSQVLRNLINVVEKIKKKKV